MTSYNRGYGRSSSNNRRYGRGGGGYGMGGVSGVSMFDCGSFLAFLGLWNNYAHVLCLVCFRPNLSTVTTE